MGKMPKLLGLTTVNEKGQLVIPVKARRAIGLKGGDEVMVFSNPDGKSLSIITTEETEKFVHDLTRQMTQAKAVKHLQDGENKQP